MNQIKLPPMHNIAQFLKNRLLSSIAIFFIVLGSGLAVSQAATDQVGSLQISYTGSTTITALNLKPGDQAGKTITIKNTGTVPHSFAIGADNVSGALADKLMIEPRINGTAVWQTSLTDLANDPNDSKTVIAAIAPGDTQVVDLIALIDPSNGNELQGLSVSSFTLKFGSETTDQSEPGPGGIGGGIPTPSSLAGSTSSGPGSVARNSGAVSSSTNQNAPTPTPSPESTLSPSPAVTPSISPTPENGEVAGASTEKDDTNCFWWWVLALVFAAFLVAYHFYTKKRPVQYEAVWPVVVGVALVGVHWLLHSTWTNCHWYLIIAEAVLLAVYYVFHMNSRQQPE